MLMIMAYVLVVTVIQIRYKRLCQIYHLHLTISKTGWLRTGLKLMMIRQNLLSLEAGSYYQNVLQQMFKWVILRLSVLHALNYLVYMDQNLTFKDHIAKKSRIAAYAMFNLKKLRPYISKNNFLPNFLTLGLW